MRSSGSFRSSRAPIAEDRQRPRAIIPATWRIADRTGDGEANDYAIAWPPNRPPFVIAAYHDAPGMETAPQEAVLRKRDAAITAWAD